jgi:hypothetical protein
MTDFPALPPSVEILELEELMFALLSKASDWCNPPGGLSTDW